VKTGKEIRRFGMGGGGVNSVVFFPDGKRVLSAHSDGGLRIWDVSTGEELRRFGGKQGESVETVALSPDGRCAVSGRLHQPYLEFWDVETGELLQKYCLGRSKTPTFDPLAKSVEPYSLDENYGISHVAFSPDGLKVAAALERTPRGRELERGRSDGAAHVILEFFEGKPEYRRRREIQHWMDGPVVCISFSPDGQQLLFSGMGWIKVCDLTSEQQDTSSGKSHIRIFSGGHSEPDTKRPGYYGVHRVSGLAFSPDGQCALSGGYDNTVRLWDTKTGKELRRFLGHTEGVNCVGFSPDGRLAISGSKDSTVRIWELPEPVNLVESESRSVSVLTCAPRIVEAPSSIAEQYNNQGASYAKKGDYAMAILAYTSAITINPKYADAYHNRALAWFFKKDYDRAWADIERCRKTGGTPDPALIQALREVTERIE
jgi:WD40 repeat protein